MAKKLYTKGERERDRTEIFTPDWVVKMMCDMLQEENAEIDVFAPEKTFLEPSCGDGNFVVEIYRRKLSRCKNRQDAQTALASVWAIERQEDNMNDCKARVRALFAEYGYPDLDFDSVFATNFIVDDALKVMRQWAEEEEPKQLSLF